MLSDDDVCWRLTRFRPNEEVEWSVEIPEVEAMAMLRACTEWKRDDVDGMWQVLDTEIFLGRFTNDDR